VFLLAGLLFYRKAVAAAGPAKVHLLLVIGLVTFVWGVLTGGFFGLGPLDFCKAGGIWNEIGALWNRICFVGADTAALTAAVESGRTEAIEALSQANMTDLRLKLMQVSFIVAVIHLVSARLREAVGLAPDQRALASVGWAVLLSGMFGLVWFLFFTSQQAEGGTLSPVFLGLLLVGFALAVLFSAPSANPVKRVGVGLAACLLPAMSTFSDTMSYIRLMAVSMASVYIAQVFNMLGSQLAEVATWGAGGLVVVFGHALNIGLCVIAIFAHGVRLNMLEFSNNAGVQWGGYPFEPFAKTTIKES
jgi:V/A-type H+-transporting ATPase subunit I